MYCDLPDFGRCCFCLPLRKGVLVFGYLSIFFNAFMVGIYSYTINYGIAGNMMMYSRVMSFPSELCIFFFCVEVVFDAILLYGAHMNLVIYVKVYYYFMISSVVGVNLLQVIDVCMFERIHFGMVLEILTLAFAALCVNLYCLLIIRSLVKKMEISGPHVYDNRLNQIVSGEANGVYNDTTAPATV